MNRAERPTARLRSGDHRNVLLEGAIDLRRVALAPRCSHHRIGFFFATHFANIAAAEKIAWLETFSGANEQLEIAQLLLRIEQLEDSVPRSRDSRQQNFSRALQRSAWNR